MRVFVEGIGLRGPGLEGWEPSRAMIAGRQPYVPAPLVVPPPALLPATERRRTVGTVKLALAIGTEALAAAGRDPAAISTVFASSGGDGETIHGIIEALAAPEREVSPTRFHNSVHNAPSGYWTIATQSREPSTSLCCFDLSFSAGLLEAAVQVTVEDRPVALICYDMPYPEPLNSARPMVSGFGVAFLLAPQRGPRAVAELEIALRPATDAASSLEDEKLEELRRGNPAARSLPLLTALARDEGRTIVIDAVAGNRLFVTTLPVAPL